MYKTASRNLQRRVDKAQKPRRGRKSARPQAGKRVHIGSHTAFHIGAGARSASGNNQFNRFLEKEAKIRLREAPIASAPISGERTADEERVRAIRLRQKQEKEQLQERIQKRSKWLKTKKRKKWPPRSKPKG